MEREAMKAAGNPWYEARIWEMGYPSELTTTEMNALAGARLNYFVKVGNKNITMNVKVIGDEWADVIRFRDWLKNDMQVRVVNLFITRPKVPYTDPGIALVQNQMIASLKAGQDAGGIAPTEYDEDGNEIPGFITSVLLSASLSASEKASRKLTKCKFTARLAGAIHFVEIKGTLTYELYERRRELWVSFTPITRRKSPFPLATTSSPATPRTVFSPSSPTPTA